MLSYSFGPHNVRGLRKMHYKFYCVAGVNLYNVSFSQNNKYTFRLSNFWGLLNLTWHRVSQGQSPVLIGTIHFILGIKQSSQNAYKKIVHKIVTEM
jgi:hypothetical protein